MRPFKIALLWLLLSFFKLSFFPSPPLPLHFSVILEHTWPSSFSRGSNEWQSWDQLLIIQERKIKSLWQNIRSLFLRGQAERQISFVDAKWLLAAAGDAAGASVCMLHGFGPEGLSKRMNKRREETRKSKDKDDASATKEMDANLGAWQEWVMENIKQQRWRRESWGRRSIKALLFPQFTNLRWLLKLIHFSE